MHITKVFRTSILGAVMASSLFSCKKAPFVEKQEVPQYVSTQLSLLRYRTSHILQDRSYKVYGYDTVEVNKHFYGDQKRFLEDLKKRAVKKTPQTEVGQHVKFQLIPKRGGGFDQIPYIEKEYKPDYKDQKVVVTTEKVFTKEGKDKIYIPVEYCGRINN